jgi:hypothetical protein
MARRVYFAFHYQIDIWRVNQVRNSWVTQDREEAGFYDASLWEKAKKDGDIGIKRMINAGLNNTTVTCLLIGQQTYARPWVRYEIIKSIEKGNGLLGIHINALHDKDGFSYSTHGRNPFDYMGVKISDNGKSADVYEYENGKWVIFSKYPQINCNCDTGKGEFIKFSELGIKLYDWKNDNGYGNFNKWVEDAAS